MAVSAAGEVATRSSYPERAVWYRNAVPSPSVVLYMNLLGRLALLFVLVPIVELMLLIQLGQIVGLGPTLLLVVATGLGGAMLARAEGLRVFFQFQQELAAGRIPGQALLDGLSVLVGGAFLLTPGVLTDLVGFSLLLPFTRRWIQRRMRARLERQIEDGTIRVVSMQAGGLGNFGGFGGEGGLTDADGEPDLDPSKGIVVDPDD